jgi:hypothetical protein
VAAAMEGVFASCVVKLNGMVRHATYFKQMHKNNQQVAGVLKQYCTLLDTILHEMQGG